MIKNKKILVFLGYLIAFILFFITSLFFIFLVKGYKYDFKSGQIRKTGMIIFSSRPSGAKIYLNDKLTKYKTGFYAFPTKISRLDPGKYNIRVTKEGYKDWQKTLEVEPELVSWANYILFVKNDLNPEKITEDLNIQNIYPSLNNRQVIFKVKSNNKDELWLFNPSSLEKNKIFPLDDQKIKGEEVKTNQEELYSIENISWSNNENYILFNKKGIENNFVVLNVRDPKDITPITNLFKLKIDNLTWNLANSNELFWFKEGALYKLKLSDKTITAPLEDKINSFIATRNKILYVKSDEKENSFWQMDLNGENKTKIIHALPVSSVYKISQSDKTDHTAILVEETKTLILTYKSDGQTLTKQFPHSINGMSWTLDGRRLMYFNKNNIWTYDIEKQKEYQVINTNTDIEYCSWYIDNTHIVLNYGSSFKIIEFDGGNLTRIANCQEKTKIIFLENYKTFFFLQKDKEKEQTNLFKIDIQ